jgi:hypothetical protein
MRFYSVLLLIMVTALSSHAQWIKLHGNVEGGKLKLYWETRDWPADLYGFNLKRRNLRAAKSEWETLNKRPISPEFIKEKDWSNLGLTENQETDIKSKFDEYLANGQMQVMDNEEVLSVLKEKGGLRSGDRIRMKNDYNLVLMSGFGYVDNTYSPNDSLEYGIFYVQDNRKEKEAVLDVYKTQNLDNLKADIEFNRINPGIELTWKLEKTKVESFGLFGFMVYRNDEGIVEGALGKYKDDENFVWWKYYDEIVDNTKDYTYAIAPVNMFQFELKQFKKKYEAKRYATLTPPELNELELVEDIHIRLSWNQLNQQIMDRVEGYRVERAEPIKNEFKAISDLLPVDSTSFVDRKYKVYGKNYIYRLVVVDDVGKEWYSKEKKILFMGQAKPPSPKNVKATYKKYGNDDYIELSWDPKAAGDTLTRGYQIYSDELKEGTLLLLISQSLITGNTYKHKIVNEGGRTFNFIVEPVGENGVQGKGVEVAHYLGTLKMPYIENIRVTVQDDHSLHLSWEYPLIDDLIGFTIFMNDKPVATEVPAEARTYLIPEAILDGSHMCYIQIQAVGKLAVSLKSLRKSLYVSGTKTEGSIPVPRNLQVKLAIKDGQKYAKLIWEKADMQQQLGIEGYALYTDDKIPNKVEKQPDVPLIKVNEYLYKLEDDERGTYRFRIASINKDNEIGLYSEVIFDKNRNNNKTEDN